MNSRNDLMKEMENELNNNYLMIKNKIKLMIEIWNEINHFLRKGKKIWVDIKDKKWIDDRNK